MPRRPHPRRVAAALTGALVVLAASATAKDARAEEALRFRAPSACPAEAKVLVDWRAELVRRGTTEVEPAAITVEQRGDRFVGLLEIGAGATRRERTLSAVDCRDLIEGLVLVHAMGAVAAPAPAPAPASPPPVRPQEPAASEDSAAPRGRAYAAVAAGVTFGLQPSAGPTARIAAGFALGRFLPEGYVAASLPNHGTFDERPASASFVAAAVGARGCFVLVERLRAGPCLGVEGLLLRGSGDHVDTPHARTSTTFAPSASVRASFGLLGPLSLALDATGALPLERPEFTLDGRAVHRSSVLVGRGTVGTELWF